MPQPCFEQNWPGPIHVSTKLEDRQKEQWVLGEQWIIRGDGRIKDRKGMSTNYEHMANHVREKVEKNLGMTK